MEGINHLTGSVNPFTDYVRSAPYKRKVPLKGVEEGINISDLISVATFLRECWLTRQVFDAKRARKSVEGLVMVAGRMLVNRKTINIKYRVGGDRFRMWLALGGREGAVSVRDAVARNLGEGV